MCMCACVCKLFLEKTSPQELLTKFLPNFTGMSLDRILFTITEKSGLWSDTSTETPQVKIVSSRLFPYTKGNHSHYFSFEW